MLQYIKVNSKGREMKYINNMTTLLLAMTLALLLSACNTKTTQDENNTTGTSSPTTQTTEDTSATGSGAVTGGTTQNGGATASNSGATTSSGGSSNTTGGSNNNATNGNTNTGSGSNNSTTGSDGNTGTGTESNSTQTDTNATTGGETNTTTGSNDGNSSTETNTTNSTTDTMPPVITLNGQSNITLEQNAVYTELGASARDDVDGDVSVSISGTVDTSTVGNYTVTYMATDSAGNEANVTRSVEVINVTPTLSSLSLESNATTVNVGETVQLFVVGTYSDNSTKAVDENISYIITPSDSAEVNGSVLTALKDGNVTVQAKVGTTLSNAINLNITWTVNGHTLPPEPDPQVNNATLLGVDVNDNGVRDDVERWIYDRYKNSHPVMIPLKMQAARAYQKVIVDPKKAYKTTKYIDDAQNCEWAFTSLSANYFGRKPLVLIEPEDAIKEDKEMEYVQYNTAQRARAYANYNQTLSGGVFELEDPSEKWIENCDFNTTKFIEMSEKL